MGKTGRGGFKMRPTLVEIVRKVLYDYGERDGMKADNIAQQINRDYQSFYGRDND
jgi:hypothetical protein